MTNDANETDGANHEVPPSPLANLRDRDGGGLLDGASASDESVDEVLRDLALSWNQLADEQRDAIRERLDLNDSYTLIAFAHRATLPALRSGEPLWSRAALAALTMVTVSPVDPRDLAWAAAVVTYTLVRLVPDGAAEIRAAATRAHGSTREILERFADEPPQTLTGWGYAFVGEGEDLSIVNCRNRPWNPTVDLLGITQRVASAVDAEGTYRDASVTIATAMPSVWVKGGPETQEAIDLVNRAVATADVDAQTADRELAANHMFVVFILELADADDAELVARAATVASINSPGLAVTNGRVVAVLIARSVVDGVDHLEDNNSLQRFQQPLFDALTP